MCIFFGGDFVFYDNLKAACALRGTSVTATLKKLGISIGSGTNWKNGMEPSLDAIIQLSEHLDVSIDYLVHGRNVTVSMLSEDEQELISIYRTLSLMDKGRLIQKAEDLSESKSDAMLLTSAVGGST